MFLMILKEIRRPGPVGAVSSSLKYPKPFIDEVALKADGGPFWDALNQLLGKFLRSNEKKRAVSGARTARTVPEDYMILRCVILNSSLIMHVAQIRIFIS